MVNRMYWITALVCGLFILLLLYSEVISNIQPSKRDKSFRILLIWGTIFCFQDMIWGVLNCPATIEKAPYIFIASTIFHIATVITTYFWLNYVLVYLGDKVKHIRAYRLLGILIVLFQAILLLRNCYTPTIFYINEQGQYCTFHWRHLAFANQYVVYLVTGIISAICYFRHKEKGSQFIAVTASALAPILTGYFQFTYPNEPFYTIGYTACCAIAHLFIISEDRKVYYELYMQEQINKQTALSKKDKLAGVYNRLAYEEDIKNKDIVFKPNFVYVSLDLNGLKEVNDDLGHEAGDEIIQAAAKCIEQSMKSYGKTYRIGGDEFAALIFANQKEIEAIKKNLNNAINNWHGKLVKSISISAGFATRDENPHLSGKELANIADASMYIEKEKYYQRKGMDRRGRSSAITALSKLYAKILKINLTTDSYQLIRMEEKEKSEAMGFSNKISVWMHDFAISGNVYRDDVVEYLNKTDIDFLKQHFSNGNKSITINYRRRIKNEYKPTFMLMIPADDYSDENQTLFLYVCEVFK